MTFSVVTLSASIKYILLDRNSFKRYLAGTAGAQMLIDATSDMFTIDMALHTTEGPTEFASYRKIGVAYSIGFGTAFGRFSTEINSRQSIAFGAGRAVITAHGLTLGYRLTK